MARKSAPAKVDKPKPKRSRAKKPGAKPGGQPGNKNAIKHGFWASHTADDQKVTLDLRKEILWLRGAIESMAVKMDVCFDTMQPMAEDDRNNIRIIYDGIDRLGNALRVHAFLSGDLSEIQREIDEGLYLARQDLGLLDYLATPERIPDSEGAGSGAES